MRGVGHIIVHIVHLAKLESFAKRQNVAVKSKYKIHLIRGMLRFDNNIEKCLKKKSEITKDIKNLFNNFKMRDYKVKANIDPSGRSYTLRTVFSFQKIDRIVIQCSHWEESFRIKNNFGGGISVIIQTEEIFKWFSSSN